MKHLLILLRAMQMFSQNAHHLVKGMSFQQDHAFFGDTYEAIAEDYDALAERIIGLYGEEHLDLSHILEAIHQVLLNAPSINVESNKVFYEYQINMEENLCEMVKHVISLDLPPGTEQLVGEIANKSEVRQYKIKQRLK